MPLLSIRMMLRSAQLREESHVGLGIRTKVGDVSGISDISTLLSLALIKDILLLYVLKILVENFVRESCLESYFRRLTNPILSSL